MYHESLLLAEAKGPIHATRLLAAAKQLLDVLGEVLDPRPQELDDRALSLTRYTLGEARFDTEWAAGLALSPKAAIALSLATGLG